PEQPTTGAPVESVTANERLVENASPPPHAAAFGAPATIERPSRPIVIPSAVTPPAPAMNSALPDGGAVQVPTIGLMKRDIGATPCVPAAIAFSPAPEPVPR